MHGSTSFLGALFVMAACSNTTSGGSSSGHPDGAAGNDADAETGGTAATGGSGGAAGTGGAAGSSGSGGVGGTGGTGGTATGDASVSCTSPAECPPPNSVCRVAVCNGTCAYEPVASGPASTQVSGDCRRIDCEFDGTANTVVDDSDQDDLNPCTVDSCTNGIATHTPTPGSPCNNGAGTCDDSGRCIECTVDSDCGTSTECTTISCVQGICSVQHAQPGALCNVSSDQCDGAGNCVDCVDNGGCGEASVCSMNLCVPA